MSVKIIALPFIPEDHVFLVPLSLLKKMKIHPDNMSRTDMARILNNYQMVRVVDKLRVKGYKPGEGGLIIK